MGGGGEKEWKKEKEERPKERGKMKYSVLLKLRQIKSIHCAKYTIRKEKKTT